ncbi:MAG: cysteine hydrolase family protein [Phycisphaerae bacterium]
MPGRGNGSAFSCVLCDLNTQQDFLASDACCPVRNAEGLVPAARRVVAWGKWNHVPVISCVDSHRGDERTHDGFPQHCLDGTRGQDKLRWTLFGSSFKVEGDNTLAVPLDLFKTYQQVIFRKRTHDLFGNPKADRYMTQLLVDEFIVFGVGLEYSLKSLVLGLLARNKRVTVVADACGFWNPSEADLALRRMHAKGADLVSVDQLWHRRLRYAMRYPLHGNGSNGHSNGNGNGNGNGRAPAKSSVTGGAGNGQAGRNGASSTGSSA